MSNELAIVENRPLAKAEIIAQKRLIQEVMRAVMKDGVHYGIIPGCKQKSLYKPGSEAILSTFRIAVEPMVEDLSIHDCYRYRVTARGVIPSGEIVGAGVGECSTDEEKYKWRSAVCDAEFNNTPEDRKRLKYGKPNNYNREGIWKQVRTNPADLANTVLKMAKKRAQIDLTLTATGASDCFTQDLEDLPEEVRDELVKEEGRQHNPAKSFNQSQERPIREDDTTPPDKDIVKRFDDCQNLDSLQEVWLSIPVSNRRLYTIIKDEAKERIAKEAANGTVGN